MAGNVRGNRTLTGSWGEVWVDGEKIFVRRLNRRWRSTARMCRWG